MLIENLFSSLSVLLTRESRDASLLVKAELLRTDATILRVSPPGLGNVDAKERNDDGSDSRESGNDHGRQIARLAQAGYERRNEDHQDHNNSTAENPHRYSL
jgi:hypothetical protein